MNKPIIIEWVLEKGRMTTRTRHYNAVVELSAHGWAIRGNRKNAGNESTPDLSTLGVFAALGIFNDWLEANGGLLLDEAAGSGESLAAAILKKLLENLNQDKEGSFFLCREVENLITAGNLAIMAIESGRADKRNTGGERG